jgi:hypothetical protein
MDSFWDCRRRSASAVRSETPFQALNGRDRQIGSQGELGIAHYWMGPIAIITHLACGLRMVLLQSAVSPRLAARLVLAFMTLGIVVSSIILVALFAVHIA